MITNLPTELLRTFTAIADSGSFSQAADIVNRTQSAVSMQIKRLEEIIEKPLLKRDSRNIKLTTDGLTLLNYARKILKLNEEAVSVLKQPELSGWVSIGIPDDYATRFLPEILASFSRTHPKVQVKVSCESSATLLTKIQRRDLDLAITASPKADVEHCMLLRQDPTVWITSDHHCQHEQRPLPLALFPTNCFSRDWIMASLDQAGIEYRIAYTSKSLNGLTAAISAGLAVSAISQSIVPAGMRQLHPEEGFPPLPSTSFLINRNPESKNCIVDSLADHIRKAFATNF